MTIPRSELGSLVLMAPLAYAAVAGLGSLRSLDLAIALGALSAVIPVLGLLRRELQVLVWVPGFFLFLVLFTVSGVASNDLPGALGGLIAGWAAVSPIYLGLGALSSKDSPGVRSLLAVLGLLTAVAVVAVAMAASYSDPSVFANAFVRFPRTQGAALAAILTGGTPTTIPFDSALPGAFVALLILGGAGALSGELSVNPEQPVEAIGFETSEPMVPEGTYRSLFPEGRDRLKEATVDRPPEAAELPSLISLVAAVVAALASLSIAATAPNLLLPMVSVIVVGVLLAVALVSYRSRSERGPPPPAPSGVPGGTPTYGQGPTRPGSPQVRP